MPKVKIIMSSTRYYSFDDVDQIRGILYPIPEWEDISCAHLEFLVAHQDLLLEECRETYPSAESVFIFVQDEMPVCRRVERLADRVDRMMEERAKTEEAERAKEEAKEAKRAEAKRKRDLAKLAKLKAELEGC